MNAAGADIRIRIHQPEGWHMTDGITPLEVYDEIVAVAAKEATLPEKAWHKELDAVGLRIGVAPRLMILHACKLLPRVTRAEVEEFSGLHVAHWLVLADRIPADEAYRRNWANRAQEMGFTAKALKAEVDVGLAARARQEGG